MFNEYEEFEVRDVEADIQTRKDLIEKAKALNESEDKNVYSELSHLQKQWRKIHGYDSALDAALNEEFDAVVDNIYAKRKAAFKDNEGIKKDLIERAKKLVKPENWNKATSEMETLMNEWRGTGSCGKEVDDTLWNEFNEARQAFFNNKHDYFEALQSKFKNAKEAKLALIAKAKELSNSTDWQQTSNALQDLLNQWKAVGNAGKDHDDALWNEFNEARQQFYDKRTAHYDALHEVQAQHATSKRDLVEQATAIATSKQYNKENNQTMKQLSDAWKQVGNAGKEEDGLWADFRSAMDSYFNGLREFNQQRQMKWRQNMKDIIARKQEIIMKQRNQIKHLQEEMAIMYSQREIDDTQDLIEDKKDFIAELEEQIADIEKRLNEQK